SNDLRFEAPDLKYIIQFGNKENDPAIQYAYFRKGIDTSWQKMNGSKLELLRSKKNYTLLVKCSNRFGKWSDESLALNVSFHEHFTKNPLFYVLLTSLISGLIYYLSKRRIEEIKENNRKISHLENKFKALKLQSMQAQMNPHFLFNAMTSIQYLLNDNDSKKADRMLTSFSKLIRMTLESSVRSVWSLKEEIEMLKLYCEIEKERFEKGNVEYNIEQINLNVEEWKIPPMMIQPFVENCFKHAFSSDKKGLLSITFTDENEKLKIVISDNGKGISQSKNSIIKNGLRGMGITHERISLYSQTIGKKIECEIKEEEENGKCIGTTVVVKIPC
ncbi:MAG: hypothetical protein RLZZ546_586, partial [Bacteroidota bacterium]